LDVEAHRGLDPWAGSSGLARLGGVSSGPRRRLRTAAGHS
jgi:hypothetical protein